MLDSKEETTVTSAIQTFMNNRDAFTSVDISNHVKENGTWVRNSEVANLLRKKFDTINSPNDYYSCRVPVVDQDSGKTVKATVYIPMEKSGQDYKNTSSRAITPDEFKALHGVDPMSVVVDAPTSTVDDTSKSTDKKDKGSSFIKKWITTFNFPKAS